MCVVPTNCDIIVATYGTGVYEGNICECVVHVASIILLNKLLKNI